MGIHLVIDLMVAAIFFGTLLIIVMRATKKRRRFRRHVNDALALFNTSK